MDKDLELKELNQFHGTERYTNVLGANVTDGVVYIMKCGYSWFVTDMLVIVKSKNFPKIAEQEFLVIKLKVKDSKAVATIEDGNGGVLYKQKYQYTDAKKDLTLYFEGNVLMLSGEY